MTSRRISIIGGGAAGFFAALAAAETDPSAAIRLYEATAHPLAKVRISGGGRCNITHACFEPRELIRAYPRGARELLGAFTRWQPRDTVAWFESRGVALKAEDDGRMFPVTDDSATIVDCLRRSASEARIEVRTTCGVKSVRRNSPGIFELDLTDGRREECDALLVASGGNRSNAGFTIAREFGHAIEAPVPSLFTVHCDDPRLRDLAGLSVEEAEVAVPAAKLSQRGPVLVTHWGLSGPAVLKLSAWGARALHDLDYRFALRINWAPASRPDDTFALLAAWRTEHPRRQAGTANPFGLPSRLWERLIPAAGLDPAATWSGVANGPLRALAMQVNGGDFAVVGKSLFKDEFVTCGGVRLSEVDFRTMESRLVPGLHFAGEVLDVDGVTGGFNFQAAWTTGWLAGRAMAGGR
ncbi:MAG TPA: NAD(P)/FAD-dependent oxidoreductase [Candidatus Didemnitutus sp.]